MKQSTQYYRRPGNVSFKPGYHKNQPQAPHSLKEDTEQRIVSLYTGGQSIESITREVGRARYLVVHVLQSRGVFGNRRAESDNVEPEPVAVADKTEERVPEPIAVSGPKSENATKEPSPKAKRVRKPKSTEQLKSLPAEKPMLKPATPQNSGGWSPLLVEALYNLVSRKDIDTGMTLEDVRKMVSRPKR